MLIMEVRRKLHVDEVDPRYSLFLWGKTDTFMDLPSWPHQLPNTHGDPSTDPLTLTHPTYLTPRTWNKNWHQYWGLFCWTYFIEIIKNFLDLFYWTSYIGFTALLLDLLCYKPVGFVVPLVFWEDILSLNFLSWCFLIFFPYLLRCHIFLESLAWLWNHCYCWSIEHSETLYVDVSCTNKFDLTAVIC